MFTFRLVMNLPLRLSLVTPITPVVLFFCNPTLRAFTVSSTHRKLHHLLSCLILFLWSMTPIASCPVMIIHISLCALMVLPFQVVFIYGERSLLHSFPFFHSLPVSGQYSKSSSVFVVILIISHIKQLRH